MVQNQRNWEKDVSFSWGFDLTFTITCQKKPSNNVIYLFETIFILMTIWASMVSNTDFMCLCFSHHNHLVRNLFCVIFCWLKNFKKKSFSHQVGPNFIHTSSDRISFFCKLKKSQKTWISFFASLKKTQKTWNLFFASLKSWKSINLIFYKLKNAQKHRFNLLQV